MSNENGKITAPVSLAADVYQVLGVTPTDGLYDVGYICGNSHGCINLFSRYKPVRYPKMEVLTDTEFGYIRHGVDFKQGNADGWKDIAGQVWEYQAPRGGSNEPFRLTDFNGYAHYATPFIAGVGMPDKMEKTAPFYIDLNYTPADQLAEGSLSIDDFDALKPCYFAAVIRHTTKNHQVYVTADEPLQGSIDFNRTITFNIQDDDMFNTGDEVEVTTFLSTTKADGQLVEPLLNVYSLKVTEAVETVRLYTVEDTYANPFYFTVEVTYNPNPTGYNVEFGYFLVTMHAPRAEGYTGGTADDLYLQFECNDPLTGGSLYSGEMRVDYYFDTRNTGAETDAYTVEQIIELHVGTTAEVTWFNIRLFRRSTQQVVATTAVGINNPDAGTQEAASGNVGDSTGQSPTSTPAKSDIDTDNPNPIIE